MGPGFEPLWGHQCAFALGALAFDIRARRSARRLSSTGASFGVRSPPSPPRDPRRGFPRHPSAALVILGLMLSFSLVTLLGSLLLGLLNLPQDVIRWAGIAVLILLGIALIVPRLEQLLVGCRRASLRRRARRASRVAGHRRRRPRLRSDPRREAGSGRAAPGAARRPAAADRVAAPERRRGSRGRGSRCDAGGRYPRQRCPARRALRVAAEAVRPRGRTRSARGCRSRNHHGRLAIAATGIRGRAR